MSYEKLNIKNGQILNETHLAHFESGIANAQATADKVAEDLKNYQTTLTIGTVTSGDVASATIENGKLNLVLPKGDTGQTGPQGPKGDKGDPGDSTSDGAGLTDTEKNLLISLFKNALYNDANMEDTLNTLKSIWKVNGEDVPIIDEYGTLLYKLSKPVKLNESSVVDSKVALFADNAVADWTVIAAYIGPVTCSQGFPRNLFCCCYDGGQGLLCRQATEGVWQVFGGRGGFGMDNCFDYSGKSYAEILQEDGKVNVISVTKSGNNFAFYLNGLMAYNSPLEYGFDSTIPEKLTLIFGGRYSSDGSSIEYKTAFTLQDARIYNKALEKSDIVSISETLMGVSA